MLLRLRNAAASMSEMNRQQERTANNLANANTVGFRRDRTFTEALRNRVDPEGNPTSARALTQWADPLVGTLEATGNPLDVALEGEGFFVVADEGGATRYTRAGRFAPAADGTLVTPEGFTVQGADGPIQLPAGGGEVAINRDGEVRVDGRAVGTLRTVAFPPDAPLERLDGASFVTDAAPEPLAAPAVLQGSVEMSNVNPLTEMSEMITHFRLFESQQKMIQTTDQALGAVTRDLGKF
jgi:flagellar basal-body rod protein FlgF/flagellar basal-body rod protein FlgG